MNKVWPLESKGKLIGYTFHCPGCKMEHVVHTETVNRLNARWTYNQRPQEPTFHPSVKVTWSDPETGKVMRTCHSFVQGGKIRFLADCSHALAGKEVPLPNYDDNGDPITEDS